MKTQIKPNLTKPFGKKPASKKPGMQKPGLQKPGKPLSKEPSKLTKPGKAIKPTSTDSVKLSKESMTANSAVSSNTSQLAQSILSGWA